MAKFLQETLRESGLKANVHILGSDAFKEFFRKVNPLLQCLYFEPTDSLPGAFDRRITID